MELNYTLVANSLSVYKNLLYYESKLSKLKDTIDDKSIIKTELLNYVKDASLKQEVLDISNIYNFSFLSNINDFRILLIAYYLDYSDDKYLTKELLLPTSIWIAKYSGLNIHNNSNILSLVDVPAIDTSNLSYIDLTCISAVNNMIRLLTNKTLSYKRKYE